MSLFDHARAPGSSEVEVLRGWNGEGWAPRRYPRTVLAMNSFEMYTYSRGTLVERHSSWADLAKEIGWSEWQLQELWRGYPNPKPLTQAARQTLEGIVNDPNEGVLDLAVRDVIANVLAPLLQNTIGGLGLYVGYSNVRDKLAQSPEIKVGGLPYVTLGVDLKAVFDEWVAEAQNESWWTRAVAFLWPADLAWFLRVDPDSCFASLSCGHDPAAALLRNPTIECRDVS